MRSRFPAATFGVALLLLGDSWGCQGTAWAQGPGVLGDRDLLEVLRAAQRANKDRYPHGRLTAQVDLGVVGEAKAGDIYQATAEWDGPRTRAIGTWLMPLRTANRKEGELIVFESIVDGKTNARALEAGKIVLYDSLDKVSAFPPSEIRPDQTWYRDGRPWVEMLGPHPNFPQDNVRDYLVEARPAGQVAVLRTDKNGAMVRMVASLPDDGNLVTYESKDPQYGQSKEIRYTWERDVRGRCFLRESMNKWTLPDPAARGRSITTYQHYKTIAFDPDFVPPPASLDPATLLRKEGYAVLDNISGKRVRNKGRDGATQSDQLGKLIDEMRKQGFAAPDRVN